MTGVDRVGIVVVSHSAALARAAVELATQMVADDPPPIAVAAGTDDGGIGTDAFAVVAALEEVASSAGVVVLTDLGSAVLSTEMALEMADVDGPIRLSPAPLVEGLVAAVVQAGAGADLDTVDREARASLSAKLDHLAADATDATDDANGVDPRSRNAPTGRDDHDPGDAPEGASVVVTVVNPQGLHARPIARVVRELAGRDATVTIANLTRGGGPVDARSLAGLAGLEAGRGDALRLSATGPDAEVVLASLAGLVETGFGEASTDQDDAGAHPGTGVGAAGHEDAGR